MGALFLAVSILILLACVVYTRALQPPPLQVIGGVACRKTVPDFVLGSLHVGQMFSGEEQGVNLAAPAPTSPRVQKIKDVMLQKDILKDITTAEFALVLDSKGAAAEIDYDTITDNLIKQEGLLNKRLQSNEPNLSDDISNKALLDRVVKTRNEVLLHQQKEQVAAASGVQAAAAAARSALAAAVDSGDSGPKRGSSKFTDATVETSVGMEELAEKELAEQALKEDLRKELQEIKESLSVIVREDGSVDWDGALSTGRQVSKLGTELWERLNGKDAEDGVPSISELLNQRTVQEKAIETPLVTTKKHIVRKKEEQLSAHLTKRDDLRVKLRGLRKDSLQVPAADINELKALDATAKEMDKRLKLYTLDLDMERICVYLQRELEASLEVAEQKLFVAEAALLEKQLTSLLFLANGQKAAGVGNFSKSPSSGYRNGVGEGVQTQVVSNEEEYDVLRFAGDVTALIDEAELTVIGNEVADLKYRLGLDSASVQVDWGSLGVVISEALTKIKLGLSFYGEGTKLLLADMQYAWGLVGKATTGTTLKPREVNTVRRTGKDLLTLIPFTIILLIPLSPIGHVLVFSFIQRFFPEFYPSCYTEKRLNLKKLYSEIERKNEDSLLGEMLKDPVNERSASRAGWFKKFLFGNVLDKFSLNRGNAVK